MDPGQLFSLALPLEHLWTVTSNALEGESRKLVLTVDLVKGTRSLPCPSCGKECRVHDRRERRWRHLNFWQYETVLTARVPRTDCSECGFHQVEVPWARPGSGFPLLFEAMAILLARDMAVSDASETRKETEEGGERSDRDPMASGAWRMALIWRREDSRQGSCGSTDTRSRRSCAEPEAGRLRRKAGRGGREPDGVRRSTDGANQIGEGPSSETRFEANGASAFEPFRHFDGEGEWEYETTRFLVDEAAAARIGEILRFGAPAAVGGTGSRSSRIAAD